MVSRTEVWGGCAAVHLDPHLLLQKKVVRLLLGLPNGVSSREGFAELGLLTLPAIHALQLLIKCKQNKWYELTNNHMYNTRGSSKIKTFPRRTKLYENSPLLRATKLYNLLHEDIALLPMKQFKGKIKKLLVAGAPYTPAEVEALLAGAY